MKRKKAKSVKPERNVSAVRATISFSSELYKTLEDIAKEKKVSLAWVVREAAEKYIADRWPLFSPANSVPSSAKPEGANH